MRAEKSLLSVPAFTDGVEIKCTFQLAGGKALEGRI
jgi:hypothetical protein